MTVLPGNGSADFARSTPAVDVAAEASALASAAKERSRGPAFSSDLTPSTTAAPSPTSRPRRRREIGGGGRCGGTRPSAPYFFGAGAGAAGAGLASVFGAAAMAVLNF